MKFIGILFITLALVGCDSSEKKNNNIAKNNPSSLRAVGEATDLIGTLSESLNLNTAIVNPASACPNEISSYLRGLSVECGAVRVPEDHRADDGRYLAVGYLKIPKTFDSNKPLLVLEQGGPGGSSMMLAAMYLMMKKDLAQQFNILAIEQRGTPWTFPVATCEDVIDVEIKLLEQSIDPVIAAREVVIAQENCLKRTSLKMNVSKISTYQIAKDIVFAANEMGFDIFNYYGVSYGTVVGQYLIKYSENNVANVVLDSPAVVGKLWMGDAVQNMDSLAKAKFEASMKKYYANLSTDDAIDFVKSTAENFETNPMTVPFDIGSKNVKAVVDKQFFMDLFFQMLVVYPDDSIAKMLLEAALTAKSNPAQAKMIFGFLLPQLGLVGQSITSIMYQSIICREFSFANFDSSEDTKNWTFIPKLFGNDAFPTDGGASSICYLNIPAADEDVILTGPVVSDKSILVVGGEFDHVTSTKYVTEVAVNMPNAHTNVFKDAAHGVFVSQPCITESVTNYLLSMTGAFNNTCL